MKASFSSNFLAIAGDDAAPTDAEGFGAVLFPMEQVIIFRMVENRVQ